MEQSAKPITSGPDRRKQSKHRVPPCKVGVVALSSQPCCFGLKRKRKFKNRNVTLLAMLEETRLVTTCKFYAVYSVWTTTQPRMFTIIYKTDSAQLLAFSRWERPGPSERQGLPTWFAVTCAQGLPAQHISEVCHRGNYDEICSPTTNTRNSLSLNKLTFP